jgi:Zn-dependent protease
MFLIIVLISWIILIIAITIHEFSHAFVADKLGDPTPKLTGRLTLNPINHLDIFGTVLLPLMALLSGSYFLIGWAKPVQIDPFNLRNPKKDNMMISLAGPISNLLLAITLSILIQLPFIGLLDYWFIGLFERLIQINVVLAIFNLIPIHPLDGFSVVAGLMPKKYYSDWLSLSSYGMLFLILLIFPFFGNSPISAIISPVVNLILSILLPTHNSGII